MRKMRGQQESTAKAGDKENDGDQGRMAGQCIHDAVGRSGHLEETLDHPREGGSTGEDCAADAQQWVGSRSAHEKKRGQDDGDDEQLHGLNTEIEGQNAADLLPAAQPQALQRGSKGQAVNEPEEPSYKGFFAGGRWDAARVLRRRR